MHKFDIFYSFWFIVLHNALSSFFSPSPILYDLLSLSLSLWPSQNSNEIMICMHLQNIACALFAVKGVEKRVVVLVGVYVLRHWHQTILWYGNGRAREEWLLTEALFGCRPRSIPPSVFLTPSFLHHLCPFLYFLTFFRYSTHLSSFFSLILSLVCLTLLSRPAVSLTYDLTMDRQDIYFFNLSVLTVKRTDWRVLG